MCASVLDDPELYSILLRIDRDLAADTRAAGCPCGGALHQADYPRKPRGAGVARREDYRRRFSFCCNVCRRRRTAPSVRFLGRRVYLGVVVTLLSAQRTGRTDRGAGPRGTAGAVPGRTRARWRQWWRTAFVETALWRAARARFRPPVAVARLPRSLLERFGDADFLAPAVMLMRFLQPLSITATS